ncbi:MAG: hypothetical protein KME46_11250 [Brasilonema angustatum HA4187-MV1]|jgi:uncharacterized protein with HEPN domain|nr:hypothetical protein [Brasilonema angustatum HA4187-MV1]
MTRRQLEDYLQDILDAIRLWRQRFAIAAIEQFTSSIEFSTFSQHLERYLASAPLTRMAIP